MEREFGPIRRPQYQAAVRNEAPPKCSRPEAKKEYLIVDGYNLIFAWDELKKLAEERLDLARGRLMDMLSSYCGYTKSELVLVFDGFRTPGTPAPQRIITTSMLPIRKTGRPATPISSGWWTRSAKTTTCASSPATI